MLVSFACSTPPLSVCVLSCARQCTKTHQAAGRARFVVRRCRSHLYVLLVTPLCRLWCISQRSCAPRLPGAASQPNSCVWPGGAKGQGRGGSTTITLPVQQDTLFTVSPRHASSNTVSLWWSFVVEFWRPRGVPRLLMVAPRVAVEGVVCLDCHSKCVVNSSTLPCSPQGVFLAWTRCTSVKTPAVLSSRLVQLTFIKSKPTQLAA